MYVQPGAVNCVVCAIAQTCMPKLYEPGHGWLARTSPVVLHLRFGVIAATSGQLRKPVIGASM